MNLKVIHELSLKEPKPILARCVKLQEEVGELAQEILIHEKVSGSLHKKEGKDGILGECVDVVTVALSIFFAHGGSLEDLQSISANKCLKWQKYQSAQT